MCVSLDHGGNEIPGLMGVVPAQVLPQHCPVEQVSNFESLALRGVVEASAEEVAEDPHNDTNTQGCHTKEANLRFEFLPDGLEKVCDCRDICRGGRGCAVQGCAEKFEVKG